MGEFASNAKGNAGVTLGTIGTALGGLNALSGGGLNGLFGGWGNNCNCHENMPVNRYEAAQSARIAELETEVKFRDANIYTDGKLLDLYKYFDGELKAVREAMCAQAVYNQKTEDAIARERDERCYGDNAVVGYVNATFYPKLVADVTTGTTTTAQALYNPLPRCGKCCG